ncbi:CCAAT-binding factor domain-containing protein [Entamoeba marina]
MVRNVLLEETEFDRIASFIKKMLAYSLMASPAFICAVLSILTEVIQKYPMLKGMFDNNHGLDDEEENYYDIDIDDDGKEVFRNKKDEIIFEYDIKKRDPLYSNAIKTKCFEINLLLNHYHPTVRSYTQALMNSTTVHMTQTIWKSLSLKTLLDRFALAKLVKETKENLKANVKRNPHLMVVNSDEFLEMKREKIPVDLLFFYDYYVDKHVEAGLKEVDVNNIDDDVDSDGMSEDLEESDDVIYNGVTKKDVSEDDEKEIDFDVAEENIIDNDMSEDDEYDYDDIVEAHQELLDDDGEIEIDDMSIDENNIIEEDDDVNE